jgi:O-antigen/teichoic acid export membrane protein
MTDSPATVAYDARPPPAGPAGGTLRRDIASAYLVTAARVGAWAVVTALVYRRLGADAFAMLALIRSTVGLLAYTSLGLAPSMVRALAAAGAGKGGVEREHSPGGQGRPASKDRRSTNCPPAADSIERPRAPSACGFAVVALQRFGLPNRKRTGDTYLRAGPENRETEKIPESPARNASALPPCPCPDTPAAGFAAPLPEAPNLPPILSYATPSGALPAREPWEPVYASGEALAMLSAVVGALLCAAYALNTDRLHSVPGPLVKPVIGMALFFGFGLLLRLLSEAPASLLQVRGKIALDNLLLAGAEVVWVAGTLISLLSTGMELLGVGLAFLAGNTFLLFGRWTIARLITGYVSGPRNGANWRDMRRLLAFGVGVAIAQAADFLYAPTDYILINCLIGTATVAVYAPAVQIDGGLLLIVTGLATALLPHSALAHAAGNRRAVRRYYVCGTLASIGLLIPAAGLVWLAAPRLLTLWLGHPMPQTLAILPIVLLNTVVGGSSAVGRSVLLAMGKVRAFSISVVLAGVVNVVLSVVFVRFFNLGLVGIILGTIVAVVGRCAIWMPWYVLWSLKKAESLGSACGTPLVITQE